MELEDVSYSDDDSSSGVVARDEVRPFTPPSSPELNDDVRPVAKTEAKRKKVKNTRRSSSNGKFVELHHDTDNSKSQPLAKRSGPIHVMPKNTLDLEVDTDPYDDDPEPEERNNKHTSEKVKCETRYESKPKKRSAKRVKELKEKPPETADNGWSGDLKGIFDIDGTTSDVVLNRTGLTWASVELGLMSKYG